MAADICALKSPQASDKLKAGLAGAACSAPAAPAAYAGNASSKTTASPTWAFAQSQAFKVVRASSTLKASSSPRRVSSDSHASSEGTGIQSGGTSRKIRSLEVPRFPIAVTVSRTRPFPRHGLAPRRTTASRSAARRPLAMKAVTMPRSYDPGALSPPEAGIPMAPATIRRAVGHDMSRYPSRPSPGRDTAHIE